MLMSLIPLASTTGISRSADADRDEASSSHDRWGSTALNFSAVFLPHVTGLLVPAIEMTESNDGSELS
jgi:hypothetical protein